MSMKQRLLNVQGDIAGSESSTDDKYNTSFFKFILATIINPIPRLFTKKNIINVNRLSPFDRNNLKQGGFAIFLVAFILTIFEIAFFYLIVIPGVNSSKTSGLTTISNNIATKLNSSKNNLKRDISKIEPIPEELIFGTIFGDFSFLLDDKSILNQEIASNGESISSDITMPSDMPRVSALYEPFASTLGNSIYNDRKEEFITKIKESDMDESIKSMLIDFINDPEEFQFKKKKLLLKLINTKINPNNPVIETVSHREALLRKKVNMYVFLTGMIIIFVLLIFLLKLRKSVITDVDFNNFKGGYKTAIKTSIITIFVIIAFQYSFYLLSKKYLFTVSGLKMCGDYDMNNFINIMKIKENATYSQEDAKKYIFKESLKNPNGNFMDITFPGSQDVCRQNNALNNKDGKCIKRFYPCHFLSKDFEKYGTGNGEMEILVMKNIKTI